MPINRQQVWISRPQEEFFLNWVENRAPIYWPIMGSGGSGKTSLLQKFHEYSSKNEIASIFIDPSKLIARYGSNGLSFLLGMETTNTPKFDKLRKSIVSSTKRLSSILLDTAISSDESLNSISRQVKDEEWGLLISTIKDAFKMAKATLDHKSQKYFEVLKEKPEELLIEALYSDLGDGGLILVDTWEQSSGLEIDSQIEFKGNGAIDTLHSAENTYSLRDYLSGIIYYTFDLNVLFIVTGRHVPAELTSLDKRHVAAKSSTEPFTRSEIDEYLDKAIGKRLSEDKDYTFTIRRITSGNPLLVSKLVQLLKEEISINPDWEWSDWKISEDEEHNILETLVERLISTSDINIDSFWRVALPKHLDNDIFKLLFFDEPSGNSSEKVLSELEDKGIIYRAGNNKQIYIHDEIRDAIKAYAIRNNFWLSEAASNLHGRLAEHYYQRGAAEKLPQYIFEGSYHALMSDSRFEERYSISREGFWSKLEHSLSLDVNEKKRIIDNITSLSADQINELIDVFTNEKANFTTLAKDHALDVLKLCSRASFGDIHKALNMFYEFVGSMPDNWEVYLYLACHKDFSSSERINWYQKSINHASAEVVASVEYAKYLSEETGKVEEAKKIFVELLKTKSRDPRVLLSWLKFNYQHCSDSEFDTENSRFLDNEEFKHEVAKYAMQLDGTTDFIEHLLNKIIDVRYASPELLVMYSMFLVREVKDEKGALGILEGGLKYNENSEQLLIAYALYQEAVLQDYEKANEVYQELDTHQSSNVQLIGRHAHLLGFHLNKPVESRELFNRVLSQDEYNFTTLLLVGRLAWLGADYDEAEKFYRLALSIQPSDVELMLYIGLILVSKDVARGVELIKSAQAGRVSAEDIATLLLVRFYGFCIEENDIKKMKALSAIEKLVSENPEARINNFHGTLFENVNIEEHLRWGDDEIKLHQKLSDERAPDEELVKYVRDLVSEFEPWFLNNPTNN